MSLTPRHRNFVLIFVSATLIVALTYLQPELRTSPFGWDWREVTQGPFEGAPRIDAGDLVPVRVLESEDADWVAELMWSTGVEGLAIGPPGEHLGIGAEVWILPEGPCDDLQPFLDHVGREGKVITWSTCPEVRAALGVPEPTPWRLEGAVAQLDGRRELGPIALPVHGAEWHEEVAEDAELVLRRAEGGVIGFIRGPAAVFSFDLADWLHRLRQGEPELAGIDTDGVHGTKPNDLRPFGWSSPTWRIPSADLWAELLVHLSEQLRDEPLERLWPLPTTAPSVLVMTSDQDFVDYEWVDPLLARVEERGGEASVLLTVHTRQERASSTEDDGGDGPGANDERLAQQWGHGLGLHPNGFGLGSPQQVERAIRLHHERLEPTLDPGSLRAIRHHALLWWGYDEPVRLAAELGYWVELNHVSINPRFRGPGFGFGAARPTRYRTRDGGVLPILSLPTQIEDDVLTGDFPYSPGLSSEQAVLASRHLLDEAIRHRVPLVANIHPLGVGLDEGVLLDGLLDAATERGVPIMSAERYATWAWDRLRRVSGQGPFEASRVPQWRWTWSVSCPDTVTVSVLGPEGCLEQVSGFDEPLDAP